MSKKKKGGTGAPLHGNVGHDLIETLAHCVTYKGQEIKLRKDDGQPDVDLILFILGFPWDKENSCAKYEYLTEDVKYHRRYDSEGVHVRNSKLPYEVRQMRVYTSYIRQDYPYKEIYRSGEILTGDFTYGGELLNILDIGTADDYNKSHYNSVEYRTMREQFVECEE